MATPHFNDLPIFNKRRITSVGQVLSVGTGYADPAPSPPPEWAALPEFVNDLSLPVGQPQSDEDPKFYLDCPSHQLDMSFDLFKHPWIGFMVRYDTRDVPPNSRDTDNFVSDVVTRYNTLIANADANGITVDRWVLKDFGFGQPSFPNFEPDTTNCFRITNRDEENVSGPGPIHHVVWHKNGVVLNQSWQDEFWPKLKTALTTNSIPDFDFYYTDHEEGEHDDVDGFYPPGGDYDISYDPSFILGPTDGGWIRNCLLDPRANNSNYKFDGVHTFQDWFYNVKFKDGTTNWPTTLPILNFGGGSAKTRTAAAWDSVQRYAARTFAWQYAMWKGTVEPMLGSFPNALALNYSFGFHIDGNPDPIAFVQNTNQEAKSSFLTWPGPTLRNYMQGPALYGGDNSRISVGVSGTLNPANYIVDDPNYFYNTSYSVADPRTVTFTNLLQDYPNISNGRFSDFRWVQLQHYKRTIYDWLRAGGTAHLMCPFVCGWGFRNQGITINTLPSTYIRDNALVAEYRDMWIEILKFCISIGVRRFVIFEGTTGVSQDPTEFAGWRGMWADILAELKPWYDQAFRAIIQA